MNRIQFWLVTSLSLLFVLFVALDVVFSRIAIGEQSRLQAQVVKAQPYLNQGQQDRVRLDVLARRIDQLAQQSQDQALKDILTRQHIVVNPPTNAASAAPAAP